MRLRNNVGLSIVIAVFRILRFNKIIEKITNEHKSEHFGTTYKHSTDYNDLSILF